MKQFLTEPINNEKDLRYFLACMRFEGVAFHPEDDVADYVHFETGEPTFTGEEIGEISLRQEEMYKLDIDPCEVAIHVNEVADLAYYYNLENSKRVDEIERALLKIAEVIKDYRLSTT
jgi:hypothetical protein